MWSVKRELNRPSIIATLHRDLYLKSLCIIKKPTFYRSQGSLNLCFCTFKCYRKIYNDYTNIWIKSVINGHGHHSPILLTFVGASKCTIRDESETGLGCPLIWPSPNRMSLKLFERVWDQILKLHRVWDRFGLLYSNLTQLYKLNIKIFLGTDI